MNTITEGTLLWEPSAAVKAKTNLVRYMKWLEDQRGLAFQSYPQLWQWSVTELQDFWESIWDFFEIQASKGYSSVLAERKMPGAD